MRQVYVDHAATTPVDARVFEAMQPFFGSLYGNPSSFHTKGKEAKDALDDARARIAHTIGARPDEILFTSGGSEADNLAILGIARAYAGQGKHLISSPTEHPAVLEALRHLQRKEGFEITWIPVDSFGRVSPEAVIAAIRPDTTLVSVMLANNEIGTISPVREIGAKIRRLREGAKSAFPYFHSDACQAVGAMEVNVEKLNVDLLTINSSKIYGPKGVGALYVKRGVKLMPMQFGGAQERGLRPGTENMAGIVGFARAIEIAQEEREAESARLIPLRDQLIAGILASIPKTRLNGHPTERLPNNINISFMDVEGEALLLYLDAKGVFASTGSACTSATLDPSHVILALGLPYEVAHGSLRFTLGRTTTKEDIDYILEVLPPLVEKLRAISPVHVDEKYYKV